MNEATRRMIRTAVQLVAAGGLTALVQQLARDAGSYGPYIFCANTLLVTWAQNYAEDAGWLKPMLKG